MANRFRKIEMRYQGGQGDVWIGERTEDGLTVAIKFLRESPTSADPKADLKRFQRELRCQSTLVHPNIAPVLGQNLKASPAWYAMPWADQSLRQMVVAAPTGLEETTVLELMGKVLSAIAYAHSEGVLHRDLKPENILIIEGEPAVSDFGLSRLLGSDSTTITMTGAMLGTLAYCAPEQFTNAHDADERADVYALGRILYELLTGRLPFPTMDLAAVPTRYRYIIAKCTEESEKARYQSVDELARELGLIEAGSTSLDPPLAQARSLLDDFVAGNKPRRAARELVRVLVDNSDDDVLYTQFVPLMPSELLVALAKNHERDLFMILRQYDECVSGSLAFSYTDTAANFLSLAFDAVSDTRIRRMILARVLVMGYEQNRWHVGEVFARLVRSSDDHSHVLMVADVMRENPRAVAFVAEFMKANSLPQIIRDVLAEAD